MKFILKINGSESEKAAYVGWTPVKCSLTIQGNAGETPILAKITTGDTGQEGKLSLYKSSAPDSNPVDEIMHILQGTEEFVFYIAGKYNHASIGKKDTYVNIESPLGQLGPEKREVMVRVRKNANTITEQEMEDFLYAFAELSKQKTKGEYETGDFTKKPVGLLDELIMMHTLDASDEIHRRTSFHPWHRVFQMHLEREIQKNHPHVTIPYWKFDEQAERVFTEKFIGKTEKTNIPVPNPNPKPHPSSSLHYGELQTPKFDAANPLYTYAQHVLWGGALRRAYRDKNPASEPPGPNLLSEKDIICHDNKYAEDRFSYWSDYEERNSHNQAHAIFTGNVVDVGKDPMDPLFFMMHGNVDRLWALWQHEYNRFDANDEKTYPYQYKYNGPRGDDWKKGREPNDDGYYKVGNTDVGNYAEDTLWPWDWDNELSRPMRRWESKREGYGAGKVPQINIKFPESDTSNYPVKDESITVKSTIDYQGRLNQQPAHGFDYDTIPYFKHDYKKLCPLPEERIARTASAFFDKALGVADRISAIDESFLARPEEEVRALQTVLNKEEENQIRVKAVRLADESKAEFLDVALTIIADATESTDLRSELIYQVFASNRSNRHYSSRKPIFFDILRGLLTGTEHQLRFQAIDILASQQDEILQEFLVEELKKEQKEQSEFISKPDAIFFLSENPKPQHAALFRRVFKESNDPKVRKAAIEGLGNDPDATELLKNVVQDNSEDFKVREAGALSLHHLDHETMNDLAAKIVAQPESGDGIMLFKSSSPNPDEVDFKAGLLNMLTFTGDVNRLKKNEGLKSTLREVVDPSTGNKANFRSSFEMATAAPSTGPTIVEQMAAKLLSRLEGNDNE